jgi:hypothetical protein
MHRGIVGLLTPSGIASDKGSSAFFKSIATTGRLAALLDFENRKGFFPDVDSRFKFCGLVFGGAKRRFPETRCAFFLHTVAELDDPQRSFTLSADDFAAVNPNTGTAPIFRYRRDAEITKAIYSRCPVLVDRRGNPPRQIWPVRYTTMFHMTNDSHLFKRRDELEAAGLYPVEGQSLAQGAGRVCAAVRRENGAGVRSPRGQHRGQLGQSASACSTRAGGFGAASECELAAGTAVLGGPVRGP